MPIRGSRRPRVSTLSRMCEWVGNSTFESRHRWHTHVGAAEGRRTRGCIRGEASSTGWTKSVRALFAALITTLLALLMHLGAGGTPRSWAPASVFVLVLWAAMITASRRSWALDPAPLYLGLGQVLMHLTMSWSRERTLRKRSYADAHSRLGGGRTAGASR